MILLYLAVAVLLLAISVEAITEIIVDSEFTAPLRNRWKKFTYPLDRPPPDNVAQLMRVWFDKLISCGYCLSVWVAGCCLALALTLWCWYGAWQFDAPALVIIWCLGTFAIHRLSNTWHVLYKLLQAGRVDTRDYKLEVRHEFRELREGPGEGGPEAQPEGAGAGDSPNGE